jgi:hypothetical protein
MPLAQPDASAAAVRPGPWIRLAPALLPVALAALLVQNYLAFARRSFWEDGFFVIRFARNFWEHGVFAWNVADGPLHGMTSQLLQLAGTLAYLLAPRHVVLLLKASLSLSLLGALLVLGRALRRAGVSHWGLLPAFVGLSCSLVLDSAGTGLETPYSFLVLAASAHVALEFHAGRRSVLPLVLVNLLVYLTRPDAILLQAALLAVLALAEPRRYVRVALGSALGLAALLVVFKLYYGTAVPLALYLKTHGLNQQAPDFVAIFAAEKTKNVVQFLFLCAPFVFMACHRRTREVTALLAAAAAFVAYHYFVTIEHMGHSSRYYLPALTFVLAAAALAFDDYRDRARPIAVAVFAVAYPLGFELLKQLDDQHKVAIMIPAERDMPVLVASVLMLVLSLRFTALAALLGGLAVVVGTARATPIEAWSFPSDRQIVVGQVTSRRTFRGMDQLRRNIPELRAIFHHDMGAPGVLFPDARVVDLDGLLNERITLEGVRFQQLCEELKPEAIYVPNPAYAALRKEVLASPCLRDYRRVDPRPDTNLRIREDLVSRYRGKP